MGTPTNTLDIELNDKFADYFRIILVISKIISNKMTDHQLHIKLAELPPKLKSEVSDFIDFLKYKSLKNVSKNSTRVSGLAKGLITMKDNFDEPIEGFNDYQQ